MWFVTGQWFSPGTLFSSTNETDRHDIAEILLKVMINTTTPDLILTLSVIFDYFIDCCLTWHKQFYIYIHDNNKFINNISCRYIDAAGLVGRKILVLREKENIWNEKGIWKKLIWKGPLTTAPNTLFLIILESCYFPNKHDALNYMLRRATWWDFQTLYFHNACADSVVITSFR